MYRKRADSTARFSAVTRLSLQTVLLVASSALLLASSAAQTAPKRALSSSHGRTKPTTQVVKTPEPVPDPPVALPPPPPPTPEQMPAQKPQVTWDGQQLTIISQNSTLSDILTEVRTLTGAALDIPPNASRERIAAQLGPGPAREVLSTLLSWTDFDYIIQASDSDPAAVQSVLLTPRGKSDGIAARGPEVVATNNPRSMRRGTHPASAVEDNPAPENTASAQPEGPVETPTPGGQPTGAPGAQTAAANASAQPAPGETPSSSQPAAAATAQAVPGETAPVSASPDAQPAQTDLISSVATSDAGAATQAQLSESERRVQQMQNLFDQRKQMMEDARKPPAN